MSSKALPRVLSGIQPSGELHIGNYVGAISQWVADQDGYVNYFLVADLHALTMPDTLDPAALRQRVRGAVALYLASGIDPKRSVIFLQSWVTAHTELAWILTCTTPLGWLQRMTQYKSKVPHAQSIGTGVLTYPVLQAADILLYQADFVPVGDDQTQHVELTQDIARRFNKLFGTVFKLPKPLVRKAGARIMGLDDPEVKMSKSLAQRRPLHAIELLDSPDQIRTKILRATTDSESSLQANRQSAGVRNLIVLYEVLSGASNSEVLARFAGRPYSDLKRALADCVVASLEPIQAEYRRLIVDDEYLDQILREGAAKAQSVANPTLARVKEVMGLR